MDELLLERLVVAVESLAKSTAEMREEQKQGRAESKKFAKQSQADVAQKTTEMVTNIMGAFTGGKK